MGVKTTHINNREKYQQRTVLSTDNGLPVSGRVEIHGAHEIFSLTTQNLNSYSNPTVSVPNTYNLNLLLVHKSKYTGQFILIDASGDTYYIERSSIDTLNNTMDIFFDNTYTGSPASIDLKKGWIIAEAKLVNKLAVSTAAHIDSVEFNGIDINVDLNGSTDSVQVVGSNGNSIEPNVDGSVNVVADTELDGLTDDDSVMTVGSEDGSLGGTRRITKIDANNRTHVTDEPVLNKMEAVLVTEPFDEVDLTYIASGDGKGELGTAIYKLSTLTVATIELTYNNKNQLINVKKV